MAIRSYSIVTVIGVAVMASVSSVMAVAAVVNFLYARGVVADHLRDRTETVAVAVSKSVAPYVEAYAVGDYAAIIAHEMESADVKAVILRDDRMGALMGGGEFVSGLVRADAGAVIDYDVRDPAHQVLLADCFHAKALPVLAADGEPIGEVFVCGSGESVQDELRRTIRDSLVSFAIAATVLIAVLLAVIRRIVIVPITKISRTVAQGDARGIPRDAVKVRGPREIVALAGGINRMVELVSQSMSRAEQGREELERHQAALSRAERTLREIIWGTDVGTWEWMVATGEATFNDRWARMLGYDLEELQPVSIETWIRLAHPDDLARSNALLERHFAGDTDFYECEARVRHKDGGWVWVLDRGKVVEWSADRKPLRMSGIHLDITERKRVEEEREKIRADLLRSNEDLEQFSYAVSHDLQAPLRNIASFLQLLQRRYAPQLDGEANEYIDFAVGGAKRLSEMIHDLLEYSRVGTQGQPFAPVALDGVVRTALQNLALMIADSHADIGVEALPTVMGDHIQLVRLFQNLIGNAVKYQPAGAVPVIWITWRRTAGAHEIAVSDNGIGIPPDLTGQLFKVFKRLHTHEQYEGTGVGLALCKRIVNRHGGRIWVQSEGAGAGSTFIFTLPDEAAVSAAGPRTPP